MSCVDGSCNCGERLDAIQKTMATKQILAELKEAMATKQDLQKLMEEIRRLFFSDSKASVNDMEALARVDVASGPAVGIRHPRQAGMAEVKADADGSTPASSTADEERAPRRVRLVVGDSSTIVENVSVITTSGGASKPPSEHDGNGEYGDTDGRA